MLKIVNNDQHIVPATVDTMPNSDNTSRSTILVNGLKESIAIDTCNAEINNLA